MISGTYIIPCTKHYIPIISTLNNSENDNDNRIDVVLIVNAKKRYTQYAQAFSIEQAAKLPAHKPWDHTINLKDPNTKVPNGPIYKITWEEEIALQRYLEENLPTRKIKQSQSAAGTPILFMKKKDSSLRLCLDYRGLNNLTILNKYPLPLINELLERTQGATWFTKLDMKNGYNLIRIASRDE